MATLAITGLISNLDTDSIINALLEVERGPITLLQQKQAVANNRLVALQTLNARLLSLSTSAQNLARTDTFQAKLVTSSNTSVLNATASYFAEIGSHRIEVQTIAQAQSFASATFNSHTEPLGLQGQFELDGSLITVLASDNLNTLANTINSQVSTVRASVLAIGQDQYRMVITRRDTGATSVNLFEAGTTNVLQSLGLVTSSTTLANPVTNGGRSASFLDDTTAVGTLIGLSSPAPSGTITLDDGSGAISVALDLETASLQDIADAINAEATLQGSTVTASVVSETMGWRTYYQLEITGAAPVSFTDENNVLQTLQVLRPQIADEVQPGQDATFVVNGVSVTRSTNLVSDVLNGVTLLLNSASPGNPVTLTINQNTTSASSAIQSFVSSYNDTRSYIRQVTAYDTQTKQAGALLGDSAVLTVERNLFDIVGTRVANVLLKDLVDLNGGSGVDTGKIQITNRSGVTAEIDLSSATSVQEIVDAINNHRTLSVKASANAAGSGLLLEDTSGGSGTFSVSDVGGSTLAADLGIAQSTSGNRIYGASVTDAGFASLVDLGITSNDNGTLNFDAGKFNQVLTNNPKLVERLFTATQVGVGQVASTKIQFITQTSGGTISNRAKALQNIVDEIDDRVETYEARITKIQQRLENQFAQLELTLAELERQSTYLDSVWQNLGNVFAYRSRR